jgi:hypothetical protein
LARKRAPGAGRKPRGDFSKKTAAITTRVTAATKGALERAAQKSGRSLSQEIEHRLDVSIRRDREFARQGHIRALAEAIALVAERVERATEKDWRNDPFTSEALRHAVEFFLFHFAAQGTPEVPASVKATAARMPPEARDGFLTPSGVGHTEAGWLISWIEMDLDQRARLSWRTLPSPHLEKSYVPDEWWVFAKLFKELGSGWAGNKSKEKEKH